ncbi:zinc finger C2HC domain-containing protein 1C-like [Tropilaelaps mercedesae]|uniref:Zinc finger C2HC domain-containing protein 1C-like n=1 Tax=Tropilaelaps mercedesae TaxID=418985 RepID=A0A1V9X8E4_9ACAR|nr:zinc finger C2HC domain-containing protein 1C-like [Tropilaelaps mercedesae]
MSRRGGCTIPRPSAALVATGGAFGSVRMPASNRATTITKANMTRAKYSNPETDDTQPPSANKSAFNGMLLANGTRPSKANSTAEKENPPLFNVTNHTPASSVQKSGYRTATAAKTNRLTSSIRPSRARDSSATTTSVQPFREPSSVTSTLESAASSTSFTYHSGHTLKTELLKPSCDSLSTKSRATLPNPILKKPNNASAIKKAPPPEERPILPECIRCDICKRGFLPDRIEKHHQACRKIESMPRKIFNATKMRTAGTEQESYIRRGAHKKEVPVKKSNWRAKHEEFLRNVREAKKVQDHIAKGGKLSDLPPPPPSENPDYVQCPHCGRKFNEGAAERHIPKCANILSNKKKTPTGKAGMAARRR